MISQKIITWISHNIEFGEKDYPSTYLQFRVYDTYRQGRGICYDFAELMIFLLRIQKIPSRYVKGLTLDTIKPVDGDIFNWYEIWEKDLLTHRLMVYCAKTSIFPDK